MAQVAVADSLQLPPDSTGKRTGMAKVNIAGTDVYLPASVLVDASGNVNDASHPVHARLTDGTSNYDGAKTGQLPSALVGSRLDVNLGAVGSGLVLPIVGSAPAQSSATWTSATALNTALTYTGLAPYGAVTIGVTVPSTLTAGVVTIETSLDGTNWTQAGSVRVDNSWAENVVPLAYFPGTGGTRQYLVSLDALTQVRVRLSTVIAGAGNTTVIIAPAQQGVEPLVATRARKVPTYTAEIRATARPYRLTNAFGAAGRKQWATIHHAASATKTVRIRRVQFRLENNTAAALIVVELVRITAATTPATGNPAVVPVSASTADAAAEATVLAQPTTAGTETGLPFGSLVYNLGITGAGPTTVPPQPLVAADLFVADPGDDEIKMPEIRAGVLEGWAITVDVNAATTVGGTAWIEFTEEPA